MKVRGMIAALLLGLMVSVASASTVNVQFSTAGTFTAGGNAALVGNSLVWTDVGGDTLTLSFAGSNVNINAPTTVELGVFSVAFGYGGDGTFNHLITAGSSFDLAITQTVPVGGPGNTGGNIGTLLLSGQIIAPTPTGGLNVVFAPTSLTLGLVTYELAVPASGKFSIAITPDNPQVSTLKADVTAIPLPAAAWAGMALFGAIGAARVRRSMKMKKA
jgi:hypothetical protein